MKVLFVCKGNTERSQMAEGFYNKYSKDGTATSAGVMPDQISLKQRIFDCMEEDGIDLTKKKIDKLTEQMVQDADKIYVLCEKEICPDFLLQSEKAEFWDITNPYKKDIEVLKKAKEEIKEKVLEMV